MLTRLAPSSNSHGVLIDISGVSETKDRLEILGTAACLGPRPAWDSAPSSRPSRGGDAQHQVAALTGSRMKSHPASLCDLQSFVHFLSNLQVGSKLSAEISCSMLCTCSSLCDLHPILMHQSFCGFFQR